MCLYVKNLSGGDRLVSNMWGVMKRTLEWNRRQNRQRKVRGAFELEKAVQS